MNNEDRETITYIGVTNFRNTNQRFGIKDKDRLGHIYCIGKTGVGKSTLLKSMALQDIQNGKGLCVIDPHGDLVQSLLSQIPEHRKNDVLYFNPADTENVLAFNPLHAVHPKYHSLVASGLIGTFKKLWAEFWGPRMEHILRHCLLTLLEYPHATLLDIQPLLTDADFRTKVLEYVKNEHTIAFWVNEFSKYSPTLKAESIAPILNKVGLFSSSVALRNVVSQPSRGIRLQQVMDGRKILLCNLSKGVIGEDACSLLGSMIVSGIQLAALYRATVPEQMRIPFFLFIDECHSFLTLSFTDILSEARKYGLGVFMTHQYIEQLDERIRPAIFGNVGTMIAFRVGACDAKYLEEEFYPEFTKEDLIGLPIYSMYLKMMIDGTASRPFSALMNNVLLKLKHPKI